MSKRSYVLKKILGVDSSSKRVEYQVIIQTGRQNITAFWTEEQIRKEGGEAILEDFLTTRQSRVKPVRKGLVCKAGTSSGGRMTTSCKIVQEGEGSWDPDLKKDFPPRYQGEMDNWNSLKLLKKDPSRFKDGVVPNPKDWRIRYHVKYTNTYPGPVIIDGKERWIIDNIVCECHLRYPTPNHSFKKGYMVRYFGWPNLEATYEPQRNISPGAIQDWEDYDAGLRSGSQNGKWYVSRGSDEDVGGSVTLSSELEELLLEEEAIVGPVVFSRDQSSKCDANKSSTELLVAKELRFWGRALKILASNAIDGFRVGQKIIGSPLRNATHSFLKGHKEFDKFLIIKSSGIRNELKSLEEFDISSPGYRKLYVVIYNSGGKQTDSSSVGFRTHACVFCLEVLPDKSRKYIFWNPNYPKPGVDEDLTPYRLILEANLIEAKNAIWLSFGDQLGSNDCILRCLQKIHLVTTGIDTFQISHKYDIKLMKPIEL